MSIEQEQTEVFSYSIDTPQRVDGSGNSATVDQFFFFFFFFSLFKDYLEKKLDDKGKQIEQKSKIASQI